LGRKTDSGAFLFNLTRRTSFPCRWYDRAIYCWKYYGPFFGLEELVVVDEPFNRKEACWSYENNYGYKIPENSKGRNMLANKNCDKYGCCYFTISSIEVWGVRFKD
jgi:hypothetical protein